MSLQVTLGFDGSCATLDEDLWQMRRVKYFDEVDLMKAAIRCTEAMYRRAREIVEPGVDELYIFDELHAAAVEAAGEPLIAILGNDYACGVPGGPPRSHRPARAGELYIFDLGPARRGYHADNCRTLSVDRRPTDAQMEVWHRVVKSLEFVEKTVKPGVRGNQLFHDVNRFLQDHGGYVLEHHLGHGIGLQPHEYPHLNPHWEDQLMQGEVISVEPGQYAPELACGMRLENQYLITDTGVENLLDFPLDLS